MDKDVIETLLSATDALRQHSNELQLQQIRLILTIARSNAIGDKPSTQQLSEVLDMPQGSVSRNTRVLGVFMEKNANGAMVRKGLDLIEGVPDVFERRRLLYQLTSKGKKLVKELSAILIEFKEA